MARALCLKAVLRLLPLLLGFCLLAPSWAADGQEVRIALVIGNSAYPTLGVLANARRDSDLVAATLRDVGFSKVTVLNDADSTAMRRGLRDFSIEADKADWAVIYFAGHAVEVSGSNHLIPIDARMLNERDVMFETVSLDQLLASAEGAKKLRLVIIDACRDNPLQKRITRSVGNRPQPGLTSVDPGSGMLVAYAAKAGQVAKDTVNHSLNSPFVISLAKHMKTPGLEINMLFRSVRDDVLESTKQEQEPTTYGSLPSAPFYFVPVIQTAAIARTEESKASPAATPQLKLTPTPPNQTNVLPPTPAAQATPALTQREALPQPSAVVERAPSTSPATETKKRVREKVRVSESVAPKASESRSADRETNRRTKLAHANPAPAPSAPAQLDYNNRVYRIDHLTGRVSACQSQKKKDGGWYSKCFAGYAGAGQQPNGNYQLVSTGASGNGRIVRIDTSTGRRSLCFIEDEQVNCRDAKR